MSKLNIDQRSIRDLLTDKKSDFLIPDYQRPYAWGKDEFIRRWKVLEAGANAIFRPMRGTPMDELFTRYMYYRRARLGIRDTTTASLRDFFGADGYAMLKEKGTFGDLEALLGFWHKVGAQEGFSDRVLRRLFVLNYAPNGMWTYLVSVWFLSNRDAEGNLDPLSKRANLEALGNKALLEKRVNSTRN